MAMLLLCYLLCLTACVWQPCRAVPRRRGCSLQTVCSWITASPGGRRLHTIGGRTLQPLGTFRFWSQPGGVGNLFDETLLRGNQP